MGGFRPSLLMMMMVVVAADGDRTVGVVKDVVADAAEDRASDEAEAARSHHDHCGVFGGRQLNNGLARMRSVPDQHCSAHLHRRRRHHHHHHRTFTGRFY